MAAVSRGVAKRFELSAGPRKEFLKVTTVTSDEAANMVAAGKLRDEPDGWESQPASDRPPYGMQGCSAVTRNN